MAWSLNRGALPVVPGREQLAHATWPGIVAFAALFVLSSLIRAAKWWWLLAPIERVSVKRVVRISLVGYAALFILPFRMGEFVRPMMVRRAGISGWAAMGTVGAERVIDGLTVTLLLAFGLLTSQTLSPLPDHIGALPVPASVVPKLGYSAVVLFGGAFAALFLFYFQRRLAQRLVEGTLGLVSRKLASWFVGRIGDLADGLGFFKTWRYSLPFVGLTLLYWLTFAGANWALLAGCGIEGVTLAQVCVVVGVFSLAILLPNAPGFFGAFQVSLYAALSMYFREEVVLGQGAAFVFYNYVGQVSLTLLLGGLALMGERRLKPEVAGAA